MSYHQHIKSEIVSKIVDPLSFKLKYRFGLSVVTEIRENEGIARMNEEWTMNGVPGKP